MALDLGTLEEILESIYNDLSAITTEAGYSVDVYKVIRQYEGLVDYGGPVLQIQSGSETVSDPLLSDLVRKSAVISIIGTINDDNVDGEDNRVVVTSTEAFVKDVQKALAANPYRMLQGIRKAWYGCVVRTATRYKPPNGTFVIAYEVTWFDTD
jgi:hypothetical protein